MENTKGGRYRQKARESSENAHFKQVSTKIIDGIADLSKGEKKAKAARRWVWELLQNAKDVACNKQVDIEIDLTEKKLEFRHSGKPFLMDNITYLIEQVSTKERGENVEDRAKIATTGKFGTGFMTTHLLSRKVKIEGVFKDEEDGVIIYKKFDLDLDRTPTSIGPMIESIRKSTEVFDVLDLDSSRTIDDYKEGCSCDTKFKYELTENSLKIAKKGISDLLDNIALTFVFVPEINSVKVVNHINNVETYFKRGTAKKLDANGIIEQIQIEKAVGDELTTHNFLLLRDTKNYVDVVAEFSEQNGVKTFVRPTKSQPVLHCVFPLVGSESFGLPVYINSPVFNPTEPRDGIFLEKGEDVEEDIDVEENQKLIESAVDLYLKLADHIKSDWDDVFWLININKPRQPVDDTWYKKIEQKINNYIIELPLVENTLGEKIKFSEALIPFPQKYSEKIWDVISFKTLDESSNYSYKFPKKEHVKTLSNLLNNSWGEDSKYKVAQLLNDIAEYKDVISLSFALNKNIVETFNWLSSLLGFVARVNKDLLNEVAIFPNQNYAFKLLSKLKEDKDIPEVLKLIYSQLSGNKKIAPKDILLNKRIELPEGLTDIKELTVKDISESIERILSNTSEDYSLMKGVLKLSKVVIDKKYLDESSLEDKNKLQLHDNQLALGVYLMQIKPPKTIFSAKYVEFITTKDSKWDYWEFVQAKDWEGFNWTEVHKWIVEKVISEIDKKGTVDSLFREEKDLAQLLPLNFLLELIHKNDFFNLEQIKTHKLFPNQLGYLQAKGHLKIDGGISESLKDAQELLCCDCDNKGKFRYQLLDKNCKVGELYGLKTYSDLDIAKKINSKIRECTEMNDYDESELSETEKVVRNQWLQGILTLFAGIEGWDDDHPRSYIWKLAQDLFPDETEKISLYKVDSESVKDVLWQSADKWFVEKVAYIISSLKTLSKLDERLGFNSMTDTAEWLEGLVSFLAQDEDYRFLLDKYSIIPNQNENFKSKNNIYIDDKIPENFKVILKELTGKDWKNTLLYKEGKGLTEIAKLYDSEEDRIITAERVAKEIDTSFSKIEEPAKEEEHFSNALKLLISWIEENRKMKKYERYIENWFSWFEKNKAQLMLDVFRDKRDDAFQIIRSDKFDELAKLAEDITISKDDISALTKDPKLFREVAGKIREEKKRKEQEQKRKQYYISMGESAEKVFNEHLSNQGFIVEFGGYGKDFKISHQNSSKYYFLELKTKSPTADEQTIEMYKSQVEMAEKHSDNYALCVVPKRGDTVTSSDIETEAIFSPSIGSIVKKSLEKANNIESNYLSEEEGVHLKYKHSEIKFCISKKNWSNGIKFKEFIEGIKEYFAIT